MAAVLEFPHAVGPFNMQPCRVAQAINAFYKQHEFPMPDPNSDENSMAGLDPAAIGLGAGEIMFCQLSPLHCITLDDETKAAANIPGKAQFFAWCYPVVDDGRRLPGTAEGLFLQYGGYVYFDNQCSAIGTNGIAPAPLGTLGLMFGRPQPLPQNVADTLTRQGRFQEITLQALADKGATHFAWIRPAEFGDKVASGNGCFAYKFQASEATYFPVVDKPVFSPEMVEETLEETEAWVVIRTSSPMIEQPIIFNRANSFMENLEESGMSNLVATTDTDVSVLCRKTKLGVMSYEQWQVSSDQGSLVEPWIFIMKSPLTMVRL